VWRLLRWKPQWRIAYWWYYWSEHNDEHNDDQLHNTCVSHCGSEVLSGYMYEPVLHELVFAGMSDEYVHNDINDHDHDRDRSLCTCE